MPDEETAPLLSAEATPGPEVQNSEASMESTPLLLSSDATPRYDVTAGANGAASVRSYESNLSSPSVKRTKSSRRWSSTIAMVVLATLVVAIMTLGFIIPDAVQEYAKEAAVLEPTNLSIQEITSRGVRARVQANFRLDASKVKNDVVRRVGKTLAWIVRELGNDESEVNVYLPEYDNVLLGTATVPPLVFHLRDGQTTAVDFVTELQPGDAEGYRTIANQWLEGQLKELRVQAKANIPIKSGILPLGTHAVSELLVFEAHKIPAMPHYNITRINIHDVPVEGSDEKQLGADVTITVYNEHPVQFNIPELEFDILVPSCQPDDQILVATAVTSAVDVQPKAEVEISVRGLVKEIPQSLTRECPDSKLSPLDKFLDLYMHGEDATVFVRGGHHQSSVPDWVGDLLSSVTVPVPFPGRNFDHLLKEFSLDDVHFTLPGDDNADPKVSGTIIVSAVTPAEMNFEVNVTKIRASSDVFYHGNKFGELNVSQWQLANSTRVGAGDGQEASLKIQSRIDEAPLKITDSDVFSEVVQEVFFGDEELMLDIKASVAVKVQTVLGQLTLKGVPAEGKIPVKPLPRGMIGSLSPEVGDVRVIDTTPSSVTIQARVNATNPTPYTAHIPYINIHVLCNGSVVGEAVAKNLDISKGNNTNFLVTATWDPTLGGAKGHRIGRDLISQYLSGFNTTITVKGHRGSIPLAPALGEALSHIPITVAAPRLELPGKEEEDRSHFIRDATFHVFSSTATFTLVSPLKHNTLYITSLNATAYYNHTEPVGVILYDKPFAATPGASETPKLPVDWSMGNVGYDKIKEALGSQLKLDAFATVGVRLGQWTDTVWYMGKGIGAHIRL